MGIEVEIVPTSPIEGQKTGTSGLRKKVKEFQKPHYLQNWLQALFNCLPPEELQGSTLVVGGDGRFWNDVAIQIIIKSALANGVTKLLVGQNGILSTPAVSALIRRRKAYGGLILTASHNPGGPDADFGIKFNCANGGPAPEGVTERIFAASQALGELREAKVPPVDLGRLGRAENVWAATGGAAEVEVVDSVADYEAALRGVFDFPALGRFLRRGGVRGVADSLHGVTGGYLARLFGPALEAPDAPLLELRHRPTLPDFGGLHPDPNLTYAADLVALLFAPDSPYSFGAAFDGDGDRNMILGRGFFVNPSDSLAVVAAYAQRAIPYFRGGLRAIARSMPTSAAADRVAQKLGVPLYEVPTGWKFFGNIMDHFEALHTPGVLCGEESFGTGSDHIREKDGLWAFFAWLSILEFRNREVPEGQPLVTVQQIVEEHWAEYGRNFYSRYDYEEVDEARAKQMMARLEELQAGLVGQTVGGLEVRGADSYRYADPFDGSETRGQGLRFLLAGPQGEGRVVFRLSGTGSAGATVRLYAELFCPPSSPPALLRLPAQDALRDLLAVALELSQLRDFTGRESPTVIT